jgi:hypothetical protein
MSDSTGAAELLGRKLTLEERIETHLKRAQADTGRDDDYVDQSDRERVKRRALILAALDAISEHDFPEIGPEGIEFEVKSELDVWSDLAVARRDFKHDVEFLDAGRSPQLILKSTRIDVDLTRPPISAKVKELILWLAVIHLHQNEVHSRFPTQQSVILQAAKATDRQPSSILTELSYFTAGVRPNAAQLTYFWDLVREVQVLARLSGDEKLAFKLLLPAALAISSTAVHKTITAHSKP